MTEDALVKPLEPIMVEVYDERDGLWWPGWCSAWRGDRVSVSFTKAPGMKYMLWLPAEHVRRV